MRHSLGLNRINSLRAEEKEEWVVVKNSPVEKSENANAKELSNGVKAAR